MLDLTTITNFTARLNQSFNPINPLRYRDYNLVLHGWSDKVYEEKDWVGLNTGSFFIRNCQWSLDLLDAWATMGPKGKVQFLTNKYSSLQIQVFNEENDGSSCEMKKILIQSSVSNFFGHELSHI